MKLTPMLGIDNQTDETQLVKGGDAPAVFLRDAVNVDINGQGLPSMRTGLRKVSSLKLLDLVRDDLHGDTFGRDSEHYLVKVEHETGTAERLHYAGNAPISLVAQAARVIIAAGEGLLEYNGQSVKPLTIQTPAAPMASLMTDGSLTEGRYTLALAWMRGDMESATSHITSIDCTAGSALRVTLPYCMDSSVDRVRVFITEANGSALQEFGTYPVLTPEIEILSVSKLLTAPRFQHMEAMPTGRYLNLWQGRLVTVSRNVLRFSEPMAFHVHDPRHGFIQMPQRITFVAGVDGGIWVGQVDHVAFLAGNDARGLTLFKKRCDRPVPNSAVVVDGSVAKETGGRQAVVWMAANGHVMGLPDGALVEPRRDIISGIFGNKGQSAVLGSKVMTVVS